jgi:hypothetical protein
MRVLLLGGGSFTLAKEFLLDPTIDFPKFQ